MTFQRLAENTASFSVFVEGFLEVVFLAACAALRVAPCTLRVAIAA
jgi:hypothetical protein